MSTEQWFSTAKWRSDSPSSDVFGGSEDFFSFCFITRPDIVSASCDKDSHKSKLGLTRWRTNTVAIRGLEVNPTEGRDHVTTPGDYVTCTPQVPSSHPTHLHNCEPHSGLHHETRDSRREPVQVHKPHSLALSWILAHQLSIHLLYDNKPYRITCLSRDLTILRYAQKRSLQSDQHKPSTDRFIPWETQPSHQPLQDRVILDHVSHR